MRSHILKMKKKNKFSCDYKLVKTFYWENQYVLGDYEITPIEYEKKEIETIEIGSIKYPKEVVENALKDIKPL